MSNKETRVKRRLEKRQQEKELAKLKEKKNRELNAATADHQRAQARAKKQG